MMASSHVAGVPPGAADPAFDLLREVAAQQARATVVVSPVSVGAALSLLSRGAAGTTRGELERLAGGGSALDTLRRSRAAVAASTGDPARRTVVEFATCLWSPPQLAFSDAFSRIAQQDFAAVAISSDAASAPARLNDWARGATRGLIRSILDAPPDPSGIVLANAVVFVGKWRSPFDPALTAPGMFHEAGGATPSVPMMARAGRFRYAAVAGGQLVDLPYEDGRHSLRIFLPEARQGLDAWLAGTSTASWAALGSALRESPGELSLPRLDLAFSAELRPALERLGVAAAFRRGVADFSPLTASKAPIHVASVVHRAVVKVDEAGTEAAASTTIVAPASAAGPRSPFRMVVDHPFFFAIHGSEPTDVLFVGVVRALS